MEQEESKRDISEKWIDNNVYQALEKIEQHERLMFNGCSDLMEYIASMNQLGNLPLIQIENMKHMITEFDILIKNTRELVNNKKKYKRSLALLKLCKFYFDNGKRIKDKRIKPYGYIIKRNPKKSFTVLNDEVFYEIANDLSKLRFIMIKNLKGILFLKSKSQESGREM